MASDSLTGRGEIVFACIAPHGDLAIPEACPPDRRTLAAATQAGMAELGRRFAAADPEVVIVLTPHGIHVEGRCAAVVASADQAHAHDADGPYGFDPAARVHDELVVALLGEARLRALRDLDPVLVAAAKPDAWWQELVLLGAIGERWTPEMLS